nr:MAG TPA: zipper dimerization domain transcription factor-like protein [Bacteriophage sp.]
MTINDLSDTSNGTMVANNLLSIQLEEQLAENQILQARVDELEALLDEQTKPAEGE